MKRFAVTAAVLILTSTAVFADPPNDPVPVPLVAIPVDASFVPNGFDDNDDVTVVLDGHLPDSCYRASHTAVLKDPATKKITLIQYARRFPGICMESLVPFSSEVFLGVLPMGEFNIESPGTSTEKLKVQESSSAGPDDFLYAPIDHVKVTYNEQAKTYTALLEGRFTNTCMKISSVDVRNSGKTLEILPKMEMTNRPSGCEATETPFSWEVVLPKDMVKGRHLAHVRSLNGKAVNQMFSVY